MKQFVTPPNNLNAEASLLGCLLLNGDLFDLVEQEGLDPEDFYELKYQIIFRAISALRNIGKTPDIITVSDYISEPDESAKVGGVAFLAELTDSTPVTSERALVEYAAIIKEKSLYRKLIKSCDSTSENCYRQEESFDAVVDMATTELITLQNTRQISTIIPIKDLVDKELSELKERLESDRSIMGISSGYSMLDEMTAGFKPGDMIVLAGRPGMGKTSFALNMALEVAKENNTVAFFSLEMPASQLLNRIIATECRINSKNFLTGRMEKDELNRLWHNIDDISKLPIFIDDTSSCTMSDIRSKVKKIKKDSGRIDAIFIDYLQLMQSTAFKDDRVRQVEDISRNIKLFAKDMGIPIIALAQLSRNVENRTSKIPMLSDLRDSGAIEQDADLVMFIHREDMYDKNTDKKGTAEIYVQKNRHGSTGSVPMLFEAQYTKFRPLDPGASTNYDI